MFGERRVAHRFHGCVQRNRSQSYFGKTGYCAISHTADVGQKVQCGRSKVKEDPNHIAVNQNSGQPLKGGGHLLRLSGQAFLINGELAHGGPGGLCRDL